ncbi:hypothetical protein [Streptomyces olivochromogenes]|uniref:Uncharacterized protein n=1 Tax=Streptomyces olivochromogenes TaxID=1963 RepID=A0A250VIA2_STROL|nr:hypothetical protein [Streptomyces olivochromogenes]KUN43234.1 hypothetical protein AQJ27_32205 [Streptomyces olivochromogenes]GAX53928.1 hypothetical protein SO3561_05459 [Streptomyces olivochromogenes]
MTGAVHIPEYLDDCELVAGEDLAHDPAFWLAHVLLMVGDPGEKPERYGVEASAYEEMVDRLGDPEQPWPVLRVPFDGGHTAHAVYANFEDMNNVDFFVRHPAWGRLGFLGDCGADEAGPGLSWAELTTLAASTQDGDEGLSDASQRLLLLLPMLGDADMPSEAPAVVSRALAHCGIRADAADELAAALLPDQADGPRWIVTGDSPIAVCSSPYSPRQVPIALGITTDQAQALADSLSGP